MPFPILISLFEGPYFPRFRNCYENLLKELTLTGMDRIILKRLYRDTLRLDPNSANPRILISQDHQTATRTRSNNPCPGHPDRFDIWDQVLSTESFSSGHHYWEVDVSLSPFCTVGVALNSMERKGRGNKCWLGWNPQSWCVRKWFDVYSVMHNHHKTPLLMLGEPERFGFFLDCEKGELRCFGDSQVLHVFRGDFRDSVKPAIWFGVCGSVRFCS
uniref:B box and SPRY domain-containing protein-like n=1 Tax=Myxine glutinosa TaxID=7769 RepID=UPI00358E3EC9